MAFNNPAASPFGGFGQTNTSTAFGSGGTTFGAGQTSSVFGGQAQQPSTFGAQQATTFGAQKPSTFGAPQATAFGAQPQSGSLFGGTQQTSTTGFGATGGSLFGGTSTAGGTTLGTQNAFGTSGGGLFGAKPTGTTFGTPASGTGFGGFGTTTSTSGFTGFGNTFNQPAATSAPSLFSGFGQTQTTGFGNTGGTTGGFGGFGQQQQQQQQQQNPAQQLMNSVCAVNIYGDERDTLIARLNALLAFAGVGKGYSSPNQPPIDYSPENALFKFTSVVYNAKPTCGQKDNLVYIDMNKKYDQVSAGEAALVNSLSGIFGSPAHMNLVIDSIQHLDSDKTRVVFYMNQKLDNGTNRRVVNTDIVAHLMQLGPQQQLKDLGVYDVQVLQSLDEDSIAQYLEHPPAGVNEILWKNAVRDNPDPKKFIPVPIVGFEGIKQRIKLQDEEAKLQTAFLNKLSARIANLNTEYEKSVATISKYKQNILALNNRLLKVIVKQEITRNGGLALTPAEEIIRSDLESVAAMINGNPTYNFRSKLSSMLSSMKLHCTPYTTSEEKYVMDPNVLSEIRTIFAVQQKSISTLMNAYNQHRSDVNIIKTDLEEILTQQQ